MTSLIAFLVLIGVLITAHELGHFIVAKLCGVKVHTFSIGFGQAIVSKTYGETEYRIALLPLGGYVRLHGMEREFGELDDEEIKDQIDGLDPDQGRALQDKPAWMRVLIFLAGPVMNLLLPFLLLPPLFYGAERYDQVIDHRMGAVDEGLPAYKAGLRDGDQILSINGKPIYAFWQVQEQVTNYEFGSPPLQVVASRPYTQEKLTVELTPEAVPSTERLAHYEQRPPRIGFQPAALSADYVVLDSLSLFAQSGGKHFDRIKKINEIEIKSHVDVAGYLAQLIQPHLSPRAVETSSPQEIGHKADPILIQIERLHALDEHFSFLRRKEIKYVELSKSELLQKVHKLLIKEPQLKSDLSGLALKALGLRQASACISSIDPKSAAAEVLQEGDCLLAVDQAQHSLAVFFEQRLRYRPEESKQLRILRKGVEIEVQLKLREESHSDPLAGKVQFWQLGFTLSGLSKVGAMVEPQTVVNKERAEFSWSRAKRQIYSELTRSVHSLSGLFSGQVSPTQLSGPITIFYLAGQQAEAGWISFINLMVLISLSIALLNLVPIPGLDGGHILFASLEMITGRPLPKNIRVYVQSVGIILILCLMLFALGNDLLRMWRLSQGS